jgi:Triose-phosphate Transporter family
MPDDRDLPIAIASDEIYNSGTEQYSTGLMKPNNYIMLPLKEIDVATSTPSKDGFAMVVTIIKTLFLVALFIIVGPALILLNKYIMQDLNFPYPLCLSGLGILSSAIFARFLVYFNFAAIERREEVEGALYYRRVLPVGIAYAGTLATGNLVYLLLDVGLIQMLKSFTPVVVMAFLFISGIESPDRPVIISILIISFGTALTCSYTPNASVLGMAVMLLSEAFEAVRLVLTQFLLKDLKMGVVEGQYVLAPATAFFLFLASICVEVPHMIRTGQFSALNNYPLLFAISAVLGIIVNFLSYFVIQLTSSLSLKILVMFRNFFVIVIGILLYKEQTSESEIVGYIFALIGFAG